VADQPPGTEIHDHTEDGQNGRREDSQKCSQFLGVICVHDVRISSLISELRNYNLESRGATTKFRTHFILQDLGQNESEGNSQIFGGKA
jgi:hypothetical protein